MKKTAIALVLGMSALTASVAHADGKELFSQKMCATCHTFNGEGATVGPSLDGIKARKTKDQIVAQIATPAAPSGNFPVPMPAGLATPEEATQIADYLLSK